MKYVDEYRDSNRVSTLIERIADSITRSWTIMEVCGGQTHSILRYGLDRLLPPQIELIHGPGCPVCVTPVECLDEAMALAGMENLVLCTFADMLRVPGTEQDLLSAKAAGADVRTIYSPLEAVTLARDNPQKEVVLFAVGFETTAPANALSVLRAEQAQLDNFSLLTSQVLVPPAIATILQAGDNRVQGFLAAGHVCTIMGTDQYQPLVERFNIPLVVTGFEPVDLLLGIEACIRQLEHGQARVENLYARWARPDGNPVARQLLEQVFTVCDRPWRGLGMIKASGLTLNSRYAAFDARRRFSLSLPHAATSGSCRAGEVLTGRLRPDQCSHFGTDCTPDCPMGAPMVSAEGACAAYYQYRDRAEGQRV